MTHVDEKDIYRRLGKKVDSLLTRAPWNETLYAILKELYSMEEADLVVKMPYGMSDFNRVARITKYEETKLRKILASLCSKGLVVDLYLNDEFYYIPSPMVVGIFEFTMMRTGGALNTKEWAKLFHKYLQSDDSFFSANCKSDDKISVLRTLPYEDAVKTSDYIEIMDYEKAVSIVEMADKFAIGLCSCRNEKLHIDEKKCDVPLETCSSFGFAADFLIRNNLAKKVSKTEMLENLARSKELGLVLNADNVKKNVTGLCHCCKCCCNALLGISKLGYANVVVTSNFISEVDEDICVGCGKCAEVCSINAIEMISKNNPESKKKIPQIDTSICLGCGVCALKCSIGAIKLVKRGKRVIYPETTFERIILQCLEKGTLQNQLFDIPQSITQKFMRGFVGAFLKLPALKRALMSDMLRSLFLKSMEKGVKVQGKGWITKV